MDITKMMGDVFNLGDDLWLWNSPYCHNWIFHHPLQNISKPDGNESLIISVRNEESKIVGIQNIKWDNCGQLIYKNQASYKRKKKYDYKREGVYISNSLILEHEIIEIIPDENDENFKSVIRKFSHIPIYRGEMELSLDTDDLYLAFDNYDVNVYRPRYSSDSFRRSLENNRPIEWNLDDEDDGNWINEYGDICSLPATELIESIEPFYNKEGRLIRIMIRVPEPPYEGPYSHVRTGISEINILYGYFAQKSKILTELNIGCHVDNLIYSEYFQEKVTFNFDTIGDLSVFIPGPKSSTVVLRDDNILVWKYYYNDNDRLCKMTLNDTINNIYRVFTVEYSDNL